MKNTGKIAVLALMVLALSGLVPACSAKGGTSTRYSSGGFAVREAMSAEAQEDSLAGGDTGADAGSGGASAGVSRKLIRNADIRIRVNSLEDADKAVAAALEQHKGYAAYSDVYDNSRRYTLKIPSASYDRVLTGLAGLGKVLSSSERVEDATLQFYDLEGRLRTKEELLKTFQSYLGQAKTIDEIMTVEKRITELQQEIEWTGSQLSGLAHLVDYATIELNLLGPVSDSPAYKPGVGERIGELFRSFGDYASTALVALAGIVIYGVPSLAVLLLLFWLLFGRIGLLRKAWRLVMGKREGPKTPEG
ncbi:MAG: DUF4349 domain-containing protein [Treponema sp.]|jgi:hypothetical protein|nr:DUF4349 domain-containing protein [Treponema sp.]